MQIQANAKYNGSCVNFYSLKNKNVSGNAIVFGRTSFNPNHCLLPDEDGSDNSSELMDEWVFTKLLRKPDYKLSVCMRALRLKHLVLDMFVIEFFSSFIFFNPLQVRTLAIVFIFILLLNSRDCMRLLKKGEKKPFLRFWQPL